MKKLIMLFLLTTMTINADYLFKIENKIIENSIINKSKNYKLSDYINYNLNYNNVDLSDVDNGNINFERPSSITLNKVLEPNKKYYLELDLPTSGNKYVLFAMGEEGFNVASFDPYSSYYPNYYNYTYNSYPYGTNTLRILIDMPNSNVVYKMNENILNSMYSSSHNISSENINTLIFGIKGAGVGRGTVKIKLDSSEFSHEIPTGYETLTGN